LVAVARDAGCLADLDQVPSGSRGLLDGWPRPSAAARLQVDQNLVAR
jgi:hypothetical protein